jgi:ion channel-forming bestrophin family protein
MLPDLQFSKVDSGVVPPLEMVNNRLTNHAESTSFFETALAWSGSVTPRVLPRVLIVSLYSMIVFLIVEEFPILGLPITPFEYSGAVLGLILVMRVNAGHDRWWEARKLWGGIVNQSRNLALVVHGYSNKNSVAASDILKWIAIWPYVMKESLRNEKNLIEVESMIGVVETSQIKKAQNMSMYVASRIIEGIKSLKEEGLDSHAFLRAETERSMLIDWIGACERIRNTSMPLVLAIKSRRFILLFVTLLPLALAQRLGWMTPFIVALASYPLFSLDEIGAELQNPFSKKNLSHLPLDEICKNISGNVLGLLRY